MAARPGDTVVVAIGSVEGANRNNTTVLYYPDTAPTQPVNLTSYVRSIFNLYPDRSSGSWSDDRTQLLSSTSGHAPWQTMMVVDLPLSLSSTTGSGKLKVTLGTNAETPSGAKNVQDVDIALEILEGEGFSNPFGFMPYAVSTTPENSELSLLEPGNQLLVKPSQAMLDTTTSYAAAEIKLNVALRNKTTGLAPAQTSNNLPGLMVLLQNTTDNDTNQVSLKWKRDGDSISIFLTSPGEGILLQALGFSIVVNKNAEFDFQGTPSLVSVKYINAAGQAVATSPGPTLKRLLAN